ncbi:Sfi1 spindle body [Ostreococcus tauri]|uniref:Sfi1 spindle body n=1 Tax=Ostreococcus tauri TaxID=70448 RepID=A0A096PBD2_OSTTA|nr:Sfi1 spindle body [Ostreococcus tauri]CEG01957.1 Sfi1 spindle body [Ostreococcus tauri]|eukprot:XP_003082815.2 Sfi1 spindle body [Ostreococcus tauri]
MLGARRNDGDDAGRSSYDALARLASSSRPSSPGGTSTASRARTERGTREVRREIDYKNGSSARTSIRAGDVVAFVTPDEGKPYVAVGERDEARDGEVRWRFEADADGVGSAQALRERQETHLEVLMHNGFIGFRSFAAKERLLQATRHGRQRLGFASVNFGTWEEWILDDAERRRLNDSAWTRCEITLKHRRLEAYRLHVTIVRVGKVVSSSTVVEEVEKDDVKSVSRHSTPRGALTAVDRFRVAREPAEEPRVRPHAMHVMGGAMMKEWAAALEKEVAARRIIEQELHELHQADDQLREWALTELNRLRQFAQSEVDSLANEVEERNKKMAEMKQQRRALELRSKMLENLDEERLNSIVDTFRRVQCGSLLRRTFAQWRHVSGAGSGMLKSKAIEHAFSKYHASGQRKYLLKRVMTAWRANAAQEKRVRRLLSSVLNRYCFVAFRTWANEYRSGKLRREVKERVAPSRRIGVHLDNALITGFQTRAELKYHHLRRAIIDHARRIPGVRVDLVSAAFEGGRETENAATYMLSDSLSDPLGSINLAREAALRRAGVESIGDVTHAFDQGVAAASRMIQARLNYVYTHADTIPEAIWLIKAYDIGESVENAAKQNRAMSRGKLLVDVSKMPTKAGRVILGAFYRGNYARDYALERRASFAKYEDAFEAGMAAGSGQYKRQEFTSQARSAVELDAICVAFDGGVANACYATNTNPFTRVQAIVDSNDSVSWLRETLMTTVEVASGNVLTTNNEFLLHKILHPLSKDMMRVSFKAWLKTHREVKESNLLVARFSARRDRRSKKETLFAWRNIATALKKRHIVLRRIGLRIKNVTLSSAFQTWADNADTIASQRVILTRYVHRMKSRLLYATFKAWAEVSTKDDRLEKMTHMILARIKRFELIKAFSAWVDHAQSAIANREKAERFILRFRNRTLAMSLRAWRENTEEMKTHRMKIRKVVVRAQNRMLAACFYQWSNLMSEKKRRSVLLERMALRLNMRLLVRSWNKWGEYVVNEKRRNNVLGKVYSRIRNTELANAFTRWREFAEESYDAKMQLRKIVSRMLRLRLSQALGRWRENTIESQRQRALLARVATRIRNRCVAQCFNAWCDTVNDNKIEAQASAYRQRLVNNLCLRINRATLREAFKKWWRVVEEREMHREMIRKVLRAKRVAMNFFMTWYWDAFDGDIQDTMADMFGSTRAYMTEAFDGADVAREALDFVRYYDNDSFEGDEGREEFTAGGSPPPPEWTNDDDFVTPSATPSKSARPSPREGFVP